MPSTLYRFWDSDDALLYVGRSINFPARFKQHKKDKGWIEEVANVTLEHLPDEESLKRVETEAIKSEHPKYNIVHNQKQSHRHRGPVGVGMTTDHQWKDEASRLARNREWVPLLSVRHFDSAYALIGGRWEDWIRASDYEFVGPRPNMNWKVTAFVDEQDRSRRQVSYDHRITTLAEIEEVRAKHAAKKRLSEATNQVMRERHPDRAWVGGSLTEWISAEAEAALRLSVDREAALCEPLEPITDPDRCMQCGEYHDPDRCVLCGEFHA